MLGIASVRVERPREAKALAIEQLEDTWKNGFEMKRYALVLLVVVGVAIGLYGRNRPPREVEGRIERTTNQQQEDWVKLFQRSGSSLSIDDSGAHFRVAKNGRGLCLGNPDDPKTIQQMEFVSQFTLTKPGEMLWSPDHHGSATFTVKQITPNGVVLSYQSSFCHFSFGKNLTSIDEGEILLEPFESRSDPEPQ